MKKLTNYTPGPRGVTMTDGEVRWIKPGQSIEVDEKNIDIVPDLGEKPRAERDGDEAALVSALDENAQLRARVAELEAAAAGKGERKPALTNRSKADLLDIAKDEGVEVADDATNAQIVEAIEAKRAA